MKLEIQSTVTCECCNGHKPLTTYQYSAGQFVNLCDECVVIKIKEVVYETKDEVCA